MAQSPDPKIARTAWDLSFQPGWVTACAFLGSPTKLAAGNQDGLILVWDLPEAAPPIPEKDAKPTDAAPLAPVRLLKGHTNVVTALALTADARWLISTSYDHSIRIWDWNAATTGTESVEVFAPAKRNDPAPEPVEVAVLAESRVLAAHTDWIRNLSLTADRTRMLTADDRGLMVLWSLPAGDEVASWNLPAGAQDVALSADGKRMAACEYNILVPSRDDPEKHHSLVRIRDVETGEVVHDLSPELAERKGAKQADKSRGLAFSPDGKLLAVGRSGWKSGMGPIHLFDAASGSKLHELKGHEQGVNRLSFTADGKYLVSSGHDTTVKFWNPADGSEVATVGAPRGGQLKDPLFAHDIAPDATRLAAADAASLVRVWQCG